MILYRVVNSQKIDNSAYSMDNTPNIYCAHTEMVDTASLIENPRNPNHHPENQVVALAKIIKHQGWRNAIVVSRRSGFIVKGHGRLLSAKMLKLEQVPVDYQDYENEASEWADMVADNRIAELSEIDKGELANILGELDGQLDLELTGFDSTELNDILAYADIPDEIELNAENTAPSPQTHISYGNRKFFMQEDEVERFEAFMNAFFQKNGNGIGLVMEILSHGDARYAN